MFTISTITVLTLPMGNEMFCLYKSDIDLQVSTWHSGSIALYPLQPGGFSSTKMEFMVLLARIAKNHNQDVTYWYRYWPIAHKGECLQFALVPAYQGLTLRFRITA